MKIIITGSLGHISKPLTEELIKKGHTVTVISSKPEKKAAIQELGATAAIGSVDYADFLTATFTGADAVYCMIPPGNFFDPNFDILSECLKLANNYKQAILKAGVKRVVHLSSVGAHKDEGVGMLRFHHLVENILRELPQEVAITHLRPVGFYYNLLSFIHAIKAQNAIITNYGGIKEPWVSPVDIAAVVAEEIVKPFEGRAIRYVASDELTCDKVADILGAAIGKPDLKWIAIPDDELLNGLLAAGMNPAIANGYVEMNISRRNGILYDDYYSNQPILGKIKLTEFAKEFAAVYNQ